MENNENNFQNEVKNVENNLKTAQEKSTAKENKSGKGKTVVLIIILLLLMLAIGILVGLMLPGNNKPEIIKQIENTITNKEDKTSKKVDESKPWVYDAEYDKDKDNKTIDDLYSSSKLKVPFININSEDAKKANEEIKQLYEKKYSEFATKNSYGATVICSLEYKYYENSNILSVVIQEGNAVTNGGAGRCPKYIYNFNLDTLKFATNEELIKKCGFNSISDVSKKVDKWIEKQLKDGEFSGTYIGLVKDTYFIDENNKLNFVYIVGAAGTYDVAQVVEEVSQDDTTDKTPNSSNTGKVVNVIGNQVDYRFMIVEGKDAQNSTVWKYTTPESNHPENIVNQGQKVIGTRNGKVYLCDWGNLYILDEQTGTVLYSNTEVNMGGAAVATFDSKNNLYTASYLAPVYQFDENGKMTKQTLDLWDCGFVTPTKMYMSSDKLLTIEYRKNSGDYDNIVDLDTETFLIENVKSTYQSDLNGKYSISRGPVNIVALSEQEIFYSFRLIRENGNMGFVDGYATKESDGTYISRREENEITFKFDGNTVTISENYDTDKHGIASPECGGGVFLSGVYNK